MDTIKLLQRCNKHLKITPKYWSGLIVGIALLFSTQAKAQIWGTSRYSRNLMYYDIATDTWTLKSTLSGGGNYGMLTSSYSNGYVYCFMYDFTGANPVGSLYRYKIATNTWELVVSAPSITDYRSHMVVNNNKVLFLGNTPTFYDIITKTTTNAQTSATVLPGAAIGNPFQASYDGTYYNYFANVSNTKSIFRYNIVSNTWGPAVASNITPIMGLLPIVNLNNAFYYAAPSGPLYKWSLATNTETKLQANADGLYNNAMTTDGVNLYMAGGSTATAGLFFKYDFATNKWVILDTALSFNSLSFDGTCVIPSATLTSTVATCTGQTANNDAQLTLTTLTGAKVGYSTGGTYTGADFATATSVGAAPFVVANSLPNPTTSQAYTVRLFNSSTCYKDFSVILSPKQCPTADLGISISPPTQTGALGEILTYTVTLTNAGPSTAENVKVSVPMPKTAATFLSASPQQGTYNEKTQIWDAGTMTVGSKTMTFSIKVN